jgi:amino acid transporter
LSRLASTEFPNLLPRFPTSGGQYFYVAILAPRSCRRYLSYITGKFCLFVSVHSPILAGWLCAITWQTGVVGGTYVAATMIQGLLVLTQPTYEFHNWHGSLLTLALIAVCVLFNTVLVKRLPQVEGLFVILHIIGIVVFIPIWIFSPLREGGAPFTEFFNGNEWSTDGLATMIGTSAPIAALIGFDCSVHMCMLILQPFLPSLTLAQPKKPRTRLVLCHSPCSLDTL